MFDALDKAGRPHDGHGHTQTHTDTHMEALQGSERVADPGLMVLLERHLREGARAEIWMTSGHVFFIIDGWRPGQGDATGLLPTLDGHMLIDGAVERGGMWGDYVRTGPVGKALRGLFLGRRVLFRLRRHIARGPAMVGRGSVVRCLRILGETINDPTRASMLRVATVQVRARVRAFLMGRGRRGASIVRDLPRELVEMIVDQTRVQHVQ